MWLFLLASRVRKTSHELNNHLPHPYRNVLYRLLTYIFPKTYIVQILLKLKPNEIAVIFIRKSFIKNTIIHIFSVICRYQKTAPKASGKFVSRRLISLLVNVIIRLLIIFRCLDVDILFITTSRRISLLLATFNDSKLFVTLPNNPFSNELSSFY